MTLGIDLNSSLDECDKDFVNGTGESTTDEGDKNLEPYNAMDFDSHQDAYSFYLKYAKFLGFGISTKSGRKSKISKEFIKAKFVCMRNGMKQESSASNQRPCLKINCKAILHIKRRLDGKWYVHNFVKEHNHELYPAQAHYFPCHRKINSPKKHNIDNLHSVGVGTSKILSALAKEHGGHENIGFLEKDIRNYLDKEQHLALAMGDAKAMFEHFMHMQEENPNFFYAIDLGEEQRLKNVFWVNATSRED